MSLTLYDKIWNDHLVDQQDDGTALLFVDRHLVHEVTSPQAFEGLRNSNRKVRQPSLTLAVADHNVPTTDRSKGIADAESKIQVDTLENNCKEFGIQYLGMDDKRQGIVHIIGPEQGFTQPGTVIVCGDSHTATHGAFGALAFGIGTSEVEHVLATQTLVQKKAKNFRINVNGKLPIGVTSKDVILQIIGVIGTAGGTVRVLSIAAGVTIKTLEAACGTGVAVIRAMPNTPSLVGEGASAIAGGAHATESDIEWAEAVLGSVGLVVRVPESQLDAVTGLAGSGPAYLFLVAEALMDAGVASGLPRATAETLVRQLFVGSAKLLAQGEAPADLRASVTSPGGTTAAGVSVLETEAVRAAFIQAVKAATDRSRELGNR